MWQQIKFGTVQYCPLPHGSCICVTERLASGQKSAGDGSAGLDIDISGLLKPHVKQRAYTPLRINILMQKNWMMKARPRKVGLCSGVRTQAIFDGHYMRQYHPIHPTISEMKKGRLAWETSCKMWGLNPPPHKVKSKQQHFTTFGVFLKKKEKPTSLTY